MGEGGIMNIVIEWLKKSDFNKARKFAVDGMHLNWYANSTPELFVYSSYFWCLEIAKASKAFGAYMGNDLLGALLVDMHNEPKMFKSIWYNVWIEIASFFINLFYKNASDTYDEANKKMLAEFKKEHNPDGEINFFAVNPNYKGKGIGTLLLNELEKQEKGKLVYLYTDSGSTYQFYSHRGFNASGATDITLEIHKKKVELTCFLYSKLF
jgi:GNAT superfamily N-acetyltransferase